MSLHRPKNPQGGWFDQSTDPALDSANGVSATSKWIDTSVTPPALKVRNAANTGWIVENAAPVILGTFPDTFTMTQGQTTATLTHTPASQVDIQIFVNGYPQDNSNITNLSGKVVKFTALNAGDVILFRYTRLD